MKIRKRIKDLKRERDQKVFDLWLACYSLREIEEKLDVPRSTIQDVIKEVSENGNIAEIYHPPDFKPQPYDVWNFGRATNEIRHPPVSCLTE